MRLRIIGKSVFMEFEHEATDDKSANKFIRDMMKINRQCALQANPKPEQTRACLVRRYHQWRERNREFKLLIQIERV